MMDITSSEQIRHLYAAQRSFFDSGATRSYAFRKKQLQKLKRVIREQEKDILQALQDDLHKPIFEGYGGEVGVVYEEINQALRHLHNWMQPEPVATS